MITTAKGLALPNEPARSVSSGDYFPVSSHTPFQFPHPLLFNYRAGVMGIVENLKAAADVSGGSQRREWEGID